MEMVAFGIQCLDRKTQGQEPPTRLCTLEWEGQGRIRNEER